MEPEPILLIGLGGVYAGLLAVGLASWRRTRALRTGSVPLLVPVRPFDGRSSPTTHLAAMGGLLLTALAARRVAAGTNPVAPWVALTATGCFVLLSAVRSRVRSIAVSSDGISIGYASGRSTNIAWSDCRGLRPPRTPIGGWRLARPSGVVTLMPSDLLGLEAALASVVVLGGLAREGGRWSRPGRLTGVKPRRRGARPPPRVLPSARPSRGRASSIRPPRSPPRSAGGRRQPPT